MKSVSEDFKAATSHPTAKIAHRLFYKVRIWNSGLSKYIWDTVWAQVPESEIVSIGSITAKLDTDRLNEFKISNVDIKLTGSKWYPWDPTSNFDPMNAKEPFWTKFKIESGWWKEDMSSIEYTPMFIGVMVGYSFDASEQSVRLNLQGLEALLLNANAEDVSNTVSNETPTGAVNGTNKDFVTLSPGVGLIDAVTVSGVTKYVGKDFDISQLNEPTTGAKITLKVAPTGGQTVKVWYRYWKQDENIEDLVTDLLTVAGVDSGANVHQVTFPGGVGDSFTFDTGADWSTGTLSECDLNTVPGDLRIDYNSGFNATQIDGFSDGNYTSTPTWTASGSGLTATWTSPNKVRLQKVNDEGIFDTPHNGAKIGSWTFGIDITSIDWAERICFAFGGHQRISNSISPFGYQYHSGDWVEIHCEHGTGDLYLRLYINGGLVGSHKLTGTVIGTGFGVRVTRTSTKCFVATNHISPFNYVDRIVYSFTSQLNFTPAYLGFGLARPRTFGDIDCKVFSILQPNTTLDATWTSPTLDMTASVLSFGTLVTDKNAGDGTITISTRTSTDGSTWDSWVAVTSQGVVGSTVKRYVQVKVELSVSSSSHNEPYVSFLKLNYRKMTTIVKLANFTGKTCYSAIQALGAFANYEWGFKEDETFFFREKQPSSGVELTFDFSDNLLSFEITSAGYENVYSEVQATFGNYDVIVADSGSSTGPLKRFGKKRLTVDGGDILISPDTDVATGIASGMFETVKSLRKLFTAKTKLMLWADLSDVVGVNTSIPFNGIYCKVVGVRHDIESMTSTFDLEEIV